jgi:acyl-coenzyme A synthetase/AMP-(fatty) acid ligase
LLSLIHVVEWRASVTGDHIALGESVGFAEQLPRNATGKVLKVVLREPHWAGQDRRVP